MNDNHDQVARGDSRNEIQEIADSRTYLQTSFHHQSPTEVTVRVLDADVIIRGYERRFGWTLLIWLLILLTAGTLAVVLLYWKPEWMLKLTHSVCPLSTARLVYIEDPYHQKYVRRLYTTLTMTDESMRQSHHLSMFLPLPDPKPQVVSNRDAKGAYILSDEGKAERINSIRWLQFQKHKLIWDSASNTFKPLVGPNTLLRAATDKQRGLSTTEVRRRQVLFGKNELLIRVNSPFKTLFLEVLNPFYIFQVYSFIVWYSEHYFYYAWVIVGMSALSLIYTTWQTHYLQRMRRDRFQSSGTVQVIRHDATSDAAQSSLTNNIVVLFAGKIRFCPAKSTALITNDQITDQVVEDRRLSVRSVTVPNNSYEKTVDSKELVPGDIIVIPAQGCELFCDAILLNGTCLGNEATLTGESIPVTKAAVEWHVSELDDVDAHDESSRRTSQQQQQQLVYLSPTSSAQQRALGGTSKNMLYAGTKVIQTRHYNNEPVKAVVMRTGYCTVKGELVTSILYPKPVDYSLHNDAMKFLLVMAVVAVIGMIYTFVMMKINGSENFQLVLRALDLVTIVVPPALPFAMTMGIVHAQTRLRKAGIFCISPRMINMAGSINLVCFDKTGTLTEEGLRLRGAIPVTIDNNNAKNLCLVDLISLETSNTENNASSDADSHKAHRDDERMDKDTTVVHQSHSQSHRFAQIPLELQICMATCHEITLVDGAFSGDPLDLEMFRVTKWDLEEPNAYDNAKYDQIAPTIVRPPKLPDGRIAGNNKANDGEISILRVMSFESKLQRMSVIIRKAGQLNDGLSSFCVCTKGAPEKIVTLCLPGTVPENFVDILTSFTQNGDRVLALAYRQLHPSVTFTSLQRMSRDELESDLQFVGFLVFENRLKPQSTPCIQELKSACIRPVMVTGDNLLTALSVSRQCSIIETPEVSLVEFVAEESGRGKQKKLRRRLVNDTNACRDNAESSASSRAVARPTLSRSGDTAVVELRNVNARCCALTGDTFQALRDGKNSAEYQQILQNGAVFARMTPAQKELLVVDLQHAGFFVGMCGDGANDCGALKTAHMGISLSNQEASAAAPYTYKHANVSCVPTCIKEGRAALDTPFAAFKFMAAYSLIQFISALILYDTNTNLSDFGFLYVDLFEVTTIVVVFGLTKAPCRLGRTAPPTRLIGLLPLLSLTLQVLIVLGFQVGAYLLVKAQPWYVPTIDDSPANSTSYFNAVTTIVAAPLVIGKPTDNSNVTDADEHYFSYQNYAVFGVSTFQYVWVAIAFSRGLPYRRPIWTNWMLTLLCLILTACNVFLMLKPCSWIVWLMEIKVPPTWHFRWIVIGLAVTNFALAIAFEWVLVAWLSLRVDRKRRQRKEHEAMTCGLGVAN